MRKRYKRRLLAILHGEPFTATPDMRELVSLLVFNGTPEARIAAGLGLTVEELRYHFADELGYSVDRLLAMCSARVIALSRQDKDLGVALRANETMLKTRLPAWREPKEVAPEPPPLERIDKLTLEEVERELARLEAGSAAPGAEDPEPESAAGRVVH